MSQKQQPSNQPVPETPVATKPRYDRDYRNKDFSQMPDWAKGLLRANNKTFGDQSDRPDFYYWVGRGAIIIDGRFTHNFQAVDMYRNLKQDVPLLRLDRDLGALQVVFVPVTPEEK